jgi:hypothetical protein
MEDGPVPSIAAGLKYPLQCGLCGDGHCYVARQHFGQKAGHLDFIALCSVANVSQSHHVSETQATVTPCSQNTQNHFPLPRTVLMVEKKDVSIPCMRAT